MIDVHHQSLARATCELMAYPRARSRQLISGSSAPDFSVDVFCHVPFEGEESHLLDRNLTSLQHFQRLGDEGYLWREDESLRPWQELGELGMRAVRMVVDGASVPVMRACERQRGVALCDFRFPSASAVADYWSQFMDMAGQVLHFVQDACVPHHAWGVLRWGHVEWEAAAADEWAKHLRMLAMANEPGLIRETLGKAVTAERFSARTIAGLVRENAAWSVSRFGNARDLPECGPIDALAVSVRAVGTSMLALRLMGVTL